MLIINTLSNTNKFSFFFLNSRCGVRAFSRVFIICKEKDFKTSKVVIR